MPWGAARALCSSISSKGDWIVRQCTLFLREDGLALSKPSVEPIISRPSTEPQQDVPLIFHHQRGSLHSSSLFSPYCPGANFQWQFPFELKRSRSVCCWDHRRHSGSDFVGGVGVRRDERARGRKYERGARDKKIIRQEQSDKQRAQRGGVANSLELCAGCEGDTKNALKPRVRHRPCRRYAEDIRRLFIAHISARSVFQGVFRKVG